MLGKMYLLIYVLCRFIVIVYIGYFLGVWVFIVCDYFGLYWCLVCKVVEGDKNFER